MEQIQQFLTTWLIQPLQLDSIATINPPTVWPLQWVYLGFLVVSLIGLIANQFLKFAPSVKQGLNSILLTNVLLGPLLFFFRYQAVPLLGINAWIYAQVLLTIAWIIFLIIQAKQQKPFIEQQKKVTDYKEKYLPKKKHK